MAKTKGPLFSLEAHGSLSKILTYSKKRTGSQARKYNKPLVAPTGAQRGQRRLTEFLVAQWQNMSAGDKATWAANARASKFNLSGYHYFLREAQRDLYTHHGLIGYWPCNRIVNNTVLDLSNNNLTASLKPGAAPNFPTLVVSKSIRFSNALTYDGTDDYCTIAAANMLNSKPQGLMLEAWIYANAAPTDTAGEILTKSLGFTLRMINNRTIVAAAGLGGVWYDNPVTSAALNLAQLYCLNVSYNDGSDKFKLYINGILAASVNESRNLDAPSSSCEFGGNVAENRQFNGLIDEICTYNRFHSAAEIATRYKFATSKI